ncbi:MAG: Rho termination factor N-terminal domain-containing protein [Acidobacteriota bacterium]
MDLHELEHKTVVELREMAAAYDDVTGVSGMKKQQLLDLLCDRLGIDRHVHAAKGIGRAAVKARLRVLRGKRDAALVAHDLVALAQVRREIKSNKRTLRRLIARSIQAQAAVKPAAG